MKKIAIVQILLTCFCALGIAQTSTLKVWMDSEVEMTADGSTVTKLNVYEYDPTYNYTTFTLTIDVPKGVSVNAGRRTDITLSPDRANGHAIDCNMPEEGTIKVVCSSLANAELYPDDESGNIVKLLFTIGLKCDPSAFNGDYKIALHDCAFARNEGNEVKGEYLDHVEYSKLTISGGTDKEDVALSVSGVGYATMYYSDRALVVPENVEAATYAVTAGGVLGISKSYATGEVIPMGEPVIVKAAQGNYTFDALVSAREKDSGNMLKGTDEEAMTEGVGWHYALALNADADPKSVGFYWMAEEGQPFMCGAHKAYLVLPEGYEAKSVFRLDDDGTTAIESVNAGTDSVNDIIYNVSGQRVNENYKGIVIKNGRKYLVR